MMGVLALVFCWSHCIGEWRHNESKIPYKSHKRLSQSIFRYGLDYLDNLFSRDVPHAEKHLRTSIKKAFGRLEIGEI
jgi:predicted component of type VI protein secretion system